MVSLVCWRAALTIASPEREDQLGGLAAFGTYPATGVRGFLDEVRCRIPELQDSSGVKLHAHAAGFCRWMAEAVVPNRTKSGRQHMTEIAAGKLDSRQGHDLGLVVMATILPAEGD